MDTNTTPLFQWNAPVQRIIERTRQWYVISGVVSLAIATYGILSGSWPLAVVSVLCGAIYYLLRDHTPRETTCAFFESGVLYDGKFNRWEEFSGFWILETPTHNELHLVFASKRKGDVIVQMLGLPVQNMKLLCGQFLTELTEKKESLIDIFSRIAKL